MLASLTPGQVVKATIAPQGKGQPSLATLSNVTFDSTDATVFTVAPDPTVLNGLIITGVGSGTALQATIQANATATEPNGTTVEQISGSDTVSCSLAPPAGPVADNLVFILTPAGTPVAPALSTPLTSVLAASKLQGS